MTFWWRDKVSGNETCEIYMNDLIKEEMEKRLKNNPSVQTKTKKWRKDNEDQLKKVAC
jgi:hypothetical protein